MTVECPYCEKPLSDEQSACCGEVGHGVVRDASPSTEGLPALLPCPFCGAKPHQGLGKVQYDQLHGDPFQRFHVKCPHGCAGMEGPDRAGAVAMWNRRSPGGAEVKQWRCFHCSETFTDATAAAEHFGPSMASIPGCQIDLAEYRRMEQLHERNLAEDTDKDRAYYRLQSEMQTAVRRAEEAGYAKGLKDAGYSGEPRGCGHVPAGYSCVTPGCSNGPAPEPTETLYTAKDVEALFAIRDAAVAAHAAKPVATAWMRDGVIENAFPRPPRSAEEWAKYDADGYWKAKGYSEAPLYSAPPSPPEPNAGQWQPIETAPHMRKIIVHYLNSAGKNRTVMACYYEKNSLEMHDDYAEVGTYDAEKDGYFADEGWYEEHDSDDPIMKLQGEPDHWMPLPTPPQTKSG